jgi:hypothetical protein
MDEKLTTTEQKTSGYRIACSDYHAGSDAGSTIPPQASLGVGSSGNAVRIIIDRKVLAGDGRRGAYRRGVPIEVDAKDPILERESADDRRRFHQVWRARSRKNQSHAAASVWVRWQYRRSPAKRPEAMAGLLRENPANKLPRLGSRITAPPSSVRLGGGDRANQSPALD